MLLFVLIIATLIFLSGGFCLSAVNRAFRRLPKSEAEKQLNYLGNWFFYRPFHHHFFSKKEYEGIIFASLCAQNITRFLYAASAITFLYQTQIINQESTYVTEHFYVSWLWFILSLVGFILISFFIGDYLPRVMGARFPEQSIKYCAPFSSFFLILAFPITYFFLKVSESLSRSIFSDYYQTPLSQEKQEIIEMIHRADLGHFAEPHEKKLIESVLTFRERIAREVMVPRVDVFSLPAETSIKDAAKLLEEEGYSRTPVHKNSIDDIIGVLMHKDILGKYMEFESKEKEPKLLEAPIETIVKPILYTPETKRISHLLQEFRKKQVHLAIVVDEYGGTAGIVTIEDILEEIVGEIADEYDTEEALYIAHPDGSWTIDARMNILDAEEKLGVKIPQEGEFETIAGYIFHRTGTIPARGFTIQHDDFELEVVRSNERSVEKVRITPIKESETGNTTPLT